MQYLREFIQFHLKDILAIMPQAVFAQGFADAVGVHDRTHLIEGFADVETVDHDLSFVERAGIFKLFVAVLVVKIGTGIPASDRHYTSSSQG